MHAPWWAGAKITVHAGDNPRDIDMPKFGNGYNYQSEEVGKCLAAGRLESDIMPLDESLAIMQTLDAIRAQWPLTYPMERKAAGGGRKRAKKVPGRKKAARKKAKKKTAKKLSKKAKTKSVKRKTSGNR
jgi:hypothetical protein